MRVTPNQLAIFIILSIGCPLRRILKIQLCIHRLSQQVVAVNCFGLDQFVLASGQAGLFIRTIRSRF